MEKYFQEIRVYPRFRSAQNAVIGKHNESRRKGRRIQSQINRRMEVL